MNRFKISISIILLTLLLFLHSGFCEKVKKSEKKSKGGAKKKTGLTGFIVGRLSPEPGLELSHFNGFYSPDEASNFCEKNIECAGFTFRGAKGVSQKFRVKFFRFVSQQAFEDAKKGGNWIWTSYRVKRSFVAIFHRQIKVDKNADNNVDNKLVKTFESLIDRSEDEKIVSNFKWKSPFSAISIPFFEKSSKAISFDEIDLSDVSVGDDSSRWITIVNLGEEAKVTSKPHLIVDTCCSKDDKVPPVNKIVELECNKISDKDFRQNFALTAQPVLLEQCSGVCTSKNWTLEDLAKEFSETDEGATWTIEENLSGKVKRIKTEQISQVLPNVRFVQAQLVSAESNLKSRKLILDSRNSTGPKIRDLFQDLGLVPISQIVIQRWTANYVTPIQSNPKGTDTFVTLLSGSQHWILIPTTEKKDLEKISCGSAKESKECQKGSWIGHIFPQIRDKFEIYGETVKEVFLQPDQTLYVPHGWSFVVKNLKDSLAITELKLTDGGIELATIALPESQIHLMKKELQEQELLRPLLRRFLEILKQRRSPGKYG